MRRIAFLISLLLYSSLFAQKEEGKYPEYSFSEFFQMIEESEDRDRK